MIATPTFLLFVAYLLGSVPFGLVLTSFGGLGDIRKIGSGNIGATNVLRTGKKSLAALTLFLDALKGALAVGMVTLAYPALAPFAGLAALLGHMFPIWLDFKGGKGVATFIGALLVLYWPAGVMVCLVWLASAFIMRISSVSAMFAVLSAPVFISIFSVYDLVPAVLWMALFILIKHGRNLVRLAQGTEPGIGKLHDKKTA